MNDIVRNNLLSEKELKAADVLQHLGIPRIENRVLIYLFKVEEATTGEIERNTGLYQPDISIATRKLMEKGWIKSSLVKQAENRGGRPYYKFFLIRSKYDIFSDIRERIEKKIQSEQQGIAALRELLEIWELPRGG